MKTKFRCLVFVFSIAFLSGCAYADKPRTNNLSWREHSPKNVIILIADGGGFNHFKSADYYQCGKTPCQPYEEFPVRLAMSTYSAGGNYDPNAASAGFDYVKSNATDSAAAATAMATGVKSYNAAIGVDANRIAVLNLVERAEQLGKSTGVVTSVPFSDATPAGFVAHDKARSNLQEIAARIVNQSAVDVIMGCGNPLYDTDGKPALLSNYKYLDNAVWTALVTGATGADADGDGISDHWTLIQTRGEFQSLAAGPTPKRVFGIPQVFETLQEKRSGNANAAPFNVPLTQTVPTLEEMTLAALNILDEDPDGFFLMVEGGAVDWAAHDNHSGRLVEEMNDFNKSIEVVLSWVDKNSNWGETLVIITADHETGCLTGPDSSRADKNPVWNDLVGNGPGKLPTMEWHSSFHTNSLVPFFAKGPGAQSFKDTVVGLDPLRGPYIDNTSIANVIFALWITN